MRQLLIVRSHTSLSIQSSRARYGALTDRSTNSRVIVCQRQLETRGRIVSAAARLFLGRSCQAVVVDAICTAADARNGGFY